MSQDTHIDPNRTSLSIRLALKAAHKARLHGASVREERRVRKREKRTFESPTE